jgi:hypothetical protein
MEFTENRPVTGLITPTENYFGRSFFIGPAPHFLPLPTIVDHNWFSKAAFH